MPVFSLMLQIKIASFIYIVTDEKYQIYLHCWGIKLPVLSSLSKSYLNKTGEYGSIIPAAQRAAAGKWSLSRCHMLTPLPNSYWRTPKGWKNGADFPLLYICSTNAAKLRLRRWDTPSGAKFYWGMLLIISVKNFEWKKQSLTCWVWRIQCVYKCV